MVMSMRSVLVALVVVVVLVMSGCGGGAASDEEPAVGALGDVLSVLEGCPNFVTEVVTGSESTGFSGAESLSQAQNRLEGDFEIAMGYAAEHYDEFGSIRFENSPQVRLVIGFTGHLGEHCSALRDLLEFPDEFELFQDGVTEANLRAIQDEVVQIAGEYSSSVGSGSARGVVTVDLRADGEQVAAEIVERYGDLVEVTVGALSYPDRSLAGGFPCGLTLPPPSDEAEALVAIVELVDPEVASGADYRGVATITNVGEEMVGYESGSPLIAFVFLPGGEDVVGVLTSNVAGVAVQADLGSGDSIEVDVIGGTASCDPELGYSLPAGAYEVRAAVEHYERPNGQFALSGILTDPAPLNVTD
jgi:hypothetical protein